MRRFFKPLYQNDCMGPEPFYSTGSYGPYNIIPRFRAKCTNIYLHSSLYAFRSYVPSTQVLERRFWTLDQFESRSRFAPRDAIAGESCPPLYRLCTDAFLISASSASQVAHGNIFRFDSIDLISNCGDNESGGRGILDFALPRCDTVILDVKNINVYCDNRDWLRMSVYV